MKRSFSRFPFAARLPDFAADDFRHRIIWLPAIVAIAVLCAGLIAAAPDSDGPSQVIVRAEPEREHQLPTHPNAPTWINLNTASQEELEALDGIGEATARRIIEERPFGSWEKLCELLIDLPRLRPAVLEGLAGLASEMTTGRACDR